uniref:Uncharacterized protein n=1 Tax=Meloidogyne javanica TaxID=6303 RepID=A0A915MFT3_MELJA
MVSKEQKRREKKRLDSRKRRSDTASVCSEEIVPDKRLNVKNEDQSSIHSEVFTAPVTPSHSHDQISEIFEDNIVTNKGGRPCKSKRVGSGRKSKNLDPVSQTAEDFENEVIQGIARELDLDDIESIESTSQISVSTVTLRRSTRHSSTISRFSDMSFSDKWPSHRPIANNCSRVHKGLGCGAKNSNHMPTYYNSLCK